MPELQQSRWLVTGGSGQVGSRLLGLGLDDVAMCAPGRDSLDLSDLGQIQTYLKAEKITAIINCAAYTAVDKAESEPELAQRINADAVGRLAAAARQRNVPLVHVSTDYVFDGKAADHFYTEADPTNPQTAYGRSKLAGEQALLASGARCAIVRTAWVVSEHGHNFIKTMMRLAKERDELGVVVDQFGCPTNARDLAAALVAVMRGLEDGRVASGELFHFVNAGSTSWLGLAERVFAAMAAAGLKVPKLNGLTTADYPTATQRPGNSRLSCAKIERSLGMVRRPWETAIDEIVENLIRHNQEAHVS